MHVRLIALAVVVALVVALPATGDAQSRPYAPLTLSATAGADRFEAKSAVPVTLAIENTSGKKLKFAFQEKDVNGKPLPFPADLTVRVVDGAGRVITENDESKDEWWSVYHTWPSVIFARKASKDRVTLDPGERVERTIDLHQILEGLETESGDLPAGTYVVQFALKGMTSNELTIDIGDVRTRLRRTDRRRRP